MAQFVRLLISRIIDLVFCVILTLQPTVVSRFSMAAKPRTEMTPEELAKQEEQEFNTGPLSVLTQSVKNNTQVEPLVVAWPER